MTKSIRVHGETTKSGGTVTNACPVRPHPITPHYICPPHGVLEPCPITKARRP